MSAIRLYVLQRFTAALMVPMILIHIALIFYATSDGLSAAEILGRTRGSIAWGAFYLTFVVAAAIHGAIGLRGVARDWLGAGERALSVILWGFGGLLLLLGVRAVVAVIFPGAT